MSTTQNRARPGAVSTSPSEERAIGALAFALYKWVLSPVLHVITPSQCKYLPTCSEYAYIALARFGVAHGSWLAMRRLFRCNPWAKGGLDPLPDREKP